MKFGRRCCVIERRCGFVSKVINLDMEFEWDERKREANVAKHGLDFVNALRIFALPMLVVYDQREDYSEDRWIGIGLLDGRVVVVVYNEPNENTIRIISLRKATTDERKRFERYLADELGAG